MSYRGEIQANTEITVKLGPFLDSGDGNTIEDGLSISQADIRLSKNGGNFAQVNHAQGGGNLTHDELGYYDLTLDATDSNTEGRLLVAVHESGALLVELSFNVLSQASYVSKYTAKDTGYMDVNIKAISEDTTAPDNLELDYDGTGYDKANSTIGTTTTNTDMRGTDNAFLAANAPPNFSSLAIDADGHVESNLVEMGDSAQSVTDLKDFADAGYDPATNKVQGVVLVDTTTTNTDMVSEPPTAAAIADQVWDEAKAGHVGVGSFGEEVQSHSLSSEISGLNDLSSAEVQSACDAAVSANTGINNILGDTNELQADWENGGRLDTILDELTTQGDTNETKIDTIDTNVDTLITRVPAEVAQKQHLADGTGDITPPTNIGIWDVLGDGTDSLNSIDAKLDTIDDYVDTEVAAIKAKTDNLPADPASETNVNANETKIDTVDTVVDAIKAVTDNLPNSGALTDIDTGVNNVEAKLPTNYIMGSSVQSDKDDEIDAIKAKTDNLPDGIQKNTALSNFEFLMLNSTDHVTPQTGLTVTAQRSIDGAAFGACANSVSEVGNGIYKINLATTDLNGDTITLRFSASGADDTLISIVTNS